MSDVSTLSAADLLVRRAVYARFADGRVPAASDVATEVGLDLPAIRDAYERLAAAHVLVLAPEDREVWMAMPFSAVPTAFRVRSGAREWYANCAWDAFGVAVALECDVVVTTTCLDCGASMTYHTHGSELVEQTGVVHFAVPARQWWDDIGFT